FPVLLAFLVKKPLAGGTDEVGIAAAIGEPVPVAAGANAGGNVALLLEDCLPGSQAAGELLGAPGRDQIPLTHHIQISHHFSGPYGKPAMLDGVRRQPSGIRLIIEERDGDDEAEALLAGLDQAGGVNLLALVGQRTDLLVPGNRDVRGRTLAVWLSEDR